MLNIWSAMGFTMALPVAIMQGGSVNYLRSISDAAFCQASVFQTAIDGKARPFALANLVVLGALFGLSNLAMALQETPDLPLGGKFALLTPLIFCVSGLITMTIAHLGYCLVYWAAARGFRGPGGMALVFDLTGLTLPAFWLLAPLFNYYLRTSNHENYAIILLSGILCSAAWAFQLIRQSLVVGQGLGKQQASMAVIGMVVFSASSIYVFMP